jgi:hypothetical protein
VAETSNLGLAMRVEKALEPIRDLAEAVDSPEAEHLRERLLGGRSLEANYERVLTLSVISQALLALEERLATVEGLLEDNLFDAH